MNLSFIFLIAALAACAASAIPVSRPGELVEDLFPRQGPDRHQRNRHQQPPRAVQIQHLTISPPNTRADSPYYRRQRAHLLDQIQHLTISAPPDTRAAHHNQITISVQAPPNTHADLHNQVLAQIQTTSAQAPPTHADSPYHQPGPVQDVLQAIKLAMEVINAAVSHASDAQAKAKHLQDINELCRLRTLYLNSRESHDIKGDLRCIQELKESAEKTIKEATASK